MTEPTRPREEARRLSEDVMRVVESERARRRRLRFAEIRERYRARRRKLLALAVLAPATLLLTALNLVGRGPLLIAVPDLSPIQQERAMMRGLNFAVRQIDAFRVENGQLPDSLGDIGRPGRGDWSYRRVGEGDYVLAVTDGRIRLAYDSRGDDAERLFRDVRKRR